MCVLEKLHFLENKNLCHVIAYILQKKKRKKDSIHISPVPLQKDIIAHI